MVICIPSGLQKLKKSVMDSAWNTRLKEVWLIHEPMATVGIGIDVMEPEGNMVIDIGGGTTDCSYLFRRNCYR